ncbi:unnamed protein product, partial [Prorocentrum cordatum]
ALLRAGAQALHAAPAVEARAAGAHAGGGPLGAPLRRRRPGGRPRAGDDARPGDELQQGGCNDTAKELQDHAAKTQDTLVDA